MVKELSPNEAKSELEKGALLVDVREAYEVDQFACDVPETLVLPLSELQQRYQELPKDRELVIACAGGGRSLYAATFLVGKGYNKVANLDGGVFTWNSLGLPVKKGGGGDEKSVSSCKLWR
ncbi:rhodanese-like domain-containing protein [Candidatus Falkowbacteria bacterium]|nr:rhodanese-like domain-containing protein [Candidatus Falkowbacteria bacterium]